MFILSCGGSCVNCFCSCPFIAFKILILEVPITNFLLPSGLIFRHCVVEKVFAVPKCVIAETPNSSSSIC